jgi:hypothetical protein
MAPCVRARSPFVRGPLRTVPVNFEFDGPGPVDGSESDDDRLTHTHELHGLALPMTSPPWRHSAVAWLMKRHACSTNTCIWRHAPERQRLLRPSANSDLRPPGTGRHAAPSPPAGQLHASRPRLRHRLDAKNFVKIFRFSVTSNLWTHAWSIKYK